MDSLHASDLPREVEGACKALLALAKARERRGRSDDNGGKIMAEVKLSLQKLAHLLESVCQSRF
eukprot:1364639-Amorphochlora_amoeboformis.AAC.1